MKGRESLQKVFHQVSSVAAYAQQRFNLCACKTFDTRSATRFKKLKLKFNLCTCKTFDKWSAIRFKKGFKNKIQIYCMCSVEWALLQNRSVYIENAVF